MIYERLLKAQQNPLAPIIRLASSMNDLPFEERISLKGRFERWIRDSINYSGFLYNGELLKQWKPTSEREDKKQKIDAFHTYSKVPDGRLTSQIKFRQPNAFKDDIGLAIVQPYTTLEHLKLCVMDADFTFPKGVAARDWEKPVDLYFSLDRSFQKLRIIPAGVVKTKVRTIMSEWFASNQNLSDSYRTFQSPSINNLQLKFKEDSGRGGYDSGLSKVICYVPEECIPTQDCTINKMIFPPDYMYEGINLRFAA